METATATVTTTALTEDDALTGIDYNPEGAMYPDWRGLNYEGYRDIATIAKIVRTEVRKAAKAGHLGPVTKVGVRIERYSGGCSMTVRLTVPNKRCTADTPGARLMPIGWNYADEEWVVTDTNCAVAHAGDRIPPDARKAMTRVERFVSTFDRNCTNSAVDYFDRAFYAHVILVEEGDTW